MNYSTIKKVVACSLVSAMGFTAMAQDGTTTSSSAKVFGGRGQYRTWSLGLNAGVLAPVVLIGGSNDFSNWNPELGYGLTLRKQLAHSFGLEFAGMRGKLSGTNERLSNTPSTFDTHLGYALSAMGVANVATIDFLRRENNVNFLVKAGAGLAAYAPSGTNPNFNWDGMAIGPVGKRREATTNVHELYIPVGVGAKFKVSDRMNFDLGYNMNFLDGDNLDGTYAKGTSKDKFSYGYAGVEFSLGSTAKPNLDWVNPVALMYDELLDPTLRQEVDALKNRVSALEGQDLLRDSDGDGVADKLDKCPGTPAGTAVDGAGCPIVHPEGTAMAVSTGSYPNIMFEFDSSVLRTSAYPILDRVSSDMRGNSGMSIDLGGHASSEGTDEYNMNLSRDRSNSVKTYLVNSGIASSRVSTHAHGEKQPIASNATESGRAQNRRVEIR
ncbi:MAG TPA: OmpA family protein [Sphingobacteriaceae bacterium]|nr:OmpA family protein [Sphingobacteriaceae bacterium]